MPNARRTNFQRIIHFVNIALFIIVLLFLFSDTSKKISLFGRNFTISFWVSLVSIPLFVFSYFFIYKTRILNRIASKLLFTFGILLFSSLAMALLLTPSYCGFGGEHPALVVIKESIKYIYDNALILYFLFIIRFFSKKQLSIYVYGLIVCWIIVAGAQFIVYLAPKSFFAVLYDQTDFLDILEDSSLIVRARYEGFSLYSFLSEPSVNCVFINTFALPFLLLKTFKSKGRTLSFFTNLTLTIIVTAGTLLTKSSSVYITFFAFVASAMYLFLKKSSLSKKIKITIVACIGVFIAFLFVVPTTRNLIVYYAVNKIFNLSNLSTAYRYSTVYNDLLILIKFPLFGCGDGNQGFFYFQHVAGTKMTVSYETVNSLTFKQGLLNGGALIPSLISGFGLFGIVLIILLFKNYFLLFKKQPLYEDSLYTLLLYVCFISVFVAGTVAIGIHRNFPLLFFLATPCINPNASNKIENLLYPIVGKKQYRIRYYSIKI